MNSQSSELMSDSDDQDIDMEPVHQPRSVAELEAAGVSKLDVEKLMNSGFHTVEAIAYTPKRALMHATSIPEQRINKVLSEG